MCRNKKDYYLVRSRTELLPAALDPLQRNDKFIALPVYISPNASGYECDFEPIYYCL